MTGSPGTVRFVGVPQKPSSFKLSTPVRVSEPWWGGERDGSSWTAKEVDGGGGKPSLGCLPPSRGESGTSKPSFLLTSVSLSLWPLYCPREPEGGLK